MYSDNIVICYIQILSCFYRYQYEYFLLCKYTLYVRIQVLIDKLSLIPISSGHTTNSICDE